MQALRQGKIPPRKSISEVILVEMLRRERSERLVLCEALITAMLLSAPKEMLSTRFYQHIHKVLAEYVFQVRTAPTAEEDAQLLKKVEAMSAAD